jgi:hypothetical protein
VLLFGTHCVYCNAFDIFSAQLSNPFVTLAAAVAVALAVVTATVLCDRPLSSWELNEFRQRCIWE